MESQRFQFILDTGYLVDNELHVVVPTLGFSVYFLNSGFWWWGLLNFGKFNISVTIVVVTFWMLKDLCLPQNHENILPSHISIDTFLQALLYWAFNIYSDPSEFKLCIWYEVEI